MKKNIVAGITDEDLVKEIKMNFLSSGVIRKRIRQLLADKEEAAYNASLSKEVYESPNWAQRQADTIGYIRALHEAISLLED